MPGRNAFHWILLLLWWVAIPTSHAGVPSFSEEKFQIAASEWKAHCKRVAFSSNLNDYLNHDAFRNLVRMGTDSIPSVMKAYQDRKVRGNCWWNFLLEDITGIKHANRGNFSPEKEDRFWFDWWKAKTSKQK